jgi:hypothetical protein
MGFCMIAGMGTAAGPGEGVGLGVGGGWEELRIAEGEDAA